MVAGLVRVRDTKFIVRHSHNFTETKPATASHEYANAVAGFAECLEIRMNATCYFLYQAEPDKALTPSAE